MAITLKVGSVEYDGFESIRVFKSLEAIAGEFSFDATIQDPEDFPIKLGDTCQVFINGIQVINGFIENLSCSTSADIHSISISGRDKTCDIIDATIDCTGKKNIEIKQAISLVNLIKSMLSKNDITGINVINNIGEIEIFKKSDTISAETGENLFELIEKYCRNRQVIATTDGLGNISLERASKKEIGHYLLSAVGEINNNIKDINFTLNNSGQFYRTTIKSQGKGKKVNISSFALDSSIRKTRNRVITADKALDTSTAKKMAEWHTNIARARSLSLSLTVQGFNYDNKDESKIWLPNRLVSIKDDFWDIDAKMLIKSVEYLFGSDGSITNLEFTNRDAYTLEAEEQEIFKKNDKKGKKLKKKEYLEGYF